MFGSFTEQALRDYAELARQKAKGNRADEDQSEYSEAWDFTTCLRPDGSLYGISRGKCRKGSEVSRAEVQRQREAAKTPKQKQREKIQKRGEAALKRNRAEEILKGLQGEGQRERKAGERRAKRDHVGPQRIDQLQNVLGKAQRTADRLRERRARLGKDSELGKRLDSRIARLNKLMGRLQSAKTALSQQEFEARKRANAKMPAWPADVQTGRQLT